MCSQAWSKLHWSCHQHFHYIALVAVFHNNCSSHIEFSSDRQPDANGSRRAVLIDYYLAGFHGSYKKSYNYGWDRKSQASQVSLQSHSCIITARGSVGKQLWHTKTCWGVNTHTFTYTLVRCYWYARLTSLVTSCSGWRVQILFYWNVTVTLQWTWKHHDHTAKMEIQLTPLKYFQKTMETVYMSSVYVDWLLFLFFSTDKGGMYVLFWPGNTCLEREHWHIIQRFRTFFLYYLIPKRNT